MQIIKDPKELQRLCMDWRCQGLKTALVPTMGYFHEGHLSLMRYARERADKVIVSLFVNPTQFGPNEDLEAYPRDFERDSALAERQGVDVLFCPEPKAMYGEDAATWVEVPELAKGLCGRSRPTHFRGVCTVVTKLFMLALPAMAVFGQKDWQQLAIIRRMVEDLNIPVEVHGHEIVREDDGLAKSSRNVYMTDEERAEAPHIRKGLLAMQQWLDDGERFAANLRDRLAAYYKENISRGSVDYIEIVHPDSLRELEFIEDRALVAVAVNLGRARLLDNLVVRS